jgi:hypothetical protein
LHRVDSLELLFCCEGVPAARNEKIVVKENTENPRKCSFKDLWVKIKIEMVCKNTVAYGLCILQVKPNDAIA